MPARPRKSSTATTAALPLEYVPELPTLVKSPPTGDEWLHEIKYDGYRIGARAERGNVSLISRNGVDWTSRFPEIVAAVKALPLSQALIDGEAAVLLPSGITSFQALQGASARGRLVYFAFDLLHLDGQDLRPEPLDERKTVLARLIGGEPADTVVIRYSQHFTGDGPGVLREACRMGLEGIVSKRSDLPYESGRTRSWLKTKCVKRQELAIGGFTDPEGSRTGIGALLVGIYENGQLRFAGKVGTGFTADMLTDLRKRLTRLLSDSCPFSVKPSGWLGRNAHWVRPELVAEVAFTEWTSDGKIRHPSFQGLRYDKPASDVTREEPVSLEEHVDTPPQSVGSAVKRRGKSSSVEVGGVRITHPERLLYNDINFSKLDLAHYYDSIAHRMLAHIEGRPLTLVRCPAGVGAECFYMKHSKVWAPGPLRRVNIPEKTKIGEYLVVDSQAALIALVQMDVLEIHTWNSTVDHLEQPDRIVFDLDPGPAVEWPLVIEAARLIKSVLQRLALMSFVKTTGGVGLHVVAPIVPELEWTQCFGIARAIAEAIVRAKPKLYTISLPKVGREHKILIDYLRNNRTNTSVAAFSTRAKPAAPVSVPLEWDELSPTRKSDYFTVRNLAERLRRLKGDPWKEYWTCRQRLRKKLLGELASLRV